MRKTCFVFVFLYFSIQIIIAQSINFDGVNRYTKKLIYNSSIDSLTLEVIKPATDNFEKAAYIYSWITQSISYNSSKRLSYDTLFRFFPISNSCIEPDCVLKERKTICSGYAMLFTAMCDIAGIESYNIEGYLNDSQRTTHVWNIFYSEFGWHVCDLTFGSGYSESGKYKHHFSSFFFNVEPKEFILTHLPAVPFWQLLPNPVSANIYFAGTSAIKTYLNYSQNIDYNYNDSIRDFLNLTPSIRYFEYAENAYKFNPVNMIILANAKLNEGIWYNNVAAAQIGAISENEILDLLLLSKNSFNKCIQLTKNCTLHECIKLYYTSLKLFQKQKIIVNEMNFRLLNN